VTRERSDQEPSCGQPVATLQLDDPQATMILGLLYEKRGETERYLRSYPDYDEPKPTDSCCEFHLVRFEESLRERGVLHQRLARVQGLIETVEALTFSEEPSTSVRPDRVELVYRAAGGELIHQNVTELTDAGTAINPETGDDLEIIAVTVGHPNDRAHP